MSPAIALPALIAPAAVALLTALVAIAFGAAWALGVLAVGSAGVVAFHLWHLGGLATLGRRPARRAGARGARQLARRVLGALSPRAHSQPRAARPRHAIERFRSAAEAIPDGMVVLDATNRIEWANARAQAHLGLDLAHDTGQPLVNLVRQPEFVRYLETGDYSDALDDRLAARSRARRCRSRSFRSASRRSCSSAATSRSSRRSRACAATSSPTCRTS